jgi:hypothetical protein
MHTELRYQVKTHTISNMPREKNILQIFPKKFIYLLFFFKKKKNTRKQNMQYGNDIICKAKSNLMMPLQKNSRSTCFFCLPQ